MLHLLAREIFRTFAQQSQPKVKRASSREMGDSVCSEERALQVSALSATGAKTCTAFSSEKNENPNHESHSFQEFKIPSSTAVLPSLGRNLPTLN